MFKQGSVFFTAAPFNQMNNRCTEHHFRHVSLKISLTLLLTLETFYYNSSSVSLASQRELLTTDPPAAQ